MQKNKQKGEEAIFTSRSQAPDGVSFTQILQIPLPQTRLAGFRQKEEPRLNSGCHGEEGKVVINHVETWRGLLLLVECIWWIWNPKVKSNKSRLNVRVALYISAEEKAQGTKNAVFPCHKDPLR